MSDEDQHPGTGPLGTPWPAHARGARVPVRTVGAAALGLVAALALSACGAGDHAPGTTGPAAGAVVRTSAPAGPPRAGTSDAAAPDAQSSPAAATISQNDVTELQAALGDAESLTKDVESDMAKDTSQ